MPVLQYADKYDKYSGYHSKDIFSKFDTTEKKYYEVRPSDM